MEVRIEASWKTRLVAEFEAPYFAKLATFVKEQYKTQTVFPPAGKMFRAFDLCPFETCKVVILGQDPYHNPGQATGLCFSVESTVTQPPSLQNIFKELASDLARPSHAKTDLVHWAKQGVLLLNAVLTVQAGQAASHAGQGWETFTDKVLSRLSQEHEHLVFVLWGSYAQKKTELIDTKKHKILASPHPSPLSAYRGFFGSKPFTKANAALESWGMSPIDW